MKQRVLEPELMDDPAISVARHRQALRGLERLNRISRSAQLVFACLRDLARPDDAPLRVLDLATGGGDVPIALDRLAQRTGVPLQIAGCDVSATAIEHARHRAAVAGAEIDFFPLNVMTQPIPLGYDVLTCSLFIHHLTTNHARHLLSKLAATVGRRVIINDLCRSPLRLMMVKLASHALSRSPVVHVDGPRSVRAAFTADELRNLAAEAAMKGARVEARWPARLLLVWDVPAARSAAAEQPVDVEEATV